MIGVLYAVFLLCVAGLIWSIWVFANPRAPGTQRVAFFMFAIVFFVVDMVNMPLVTVIPGELGSHWFATHLYVGMTRDQVGDVRRSTLGSDDGENQGVPVILYYTGGTLCTVWGKRYKLYFDKRDLLATWKYDTWNEGTCD
jgi:hypothetical protein